MKKEVETLIAWLKESYMKDARIRPNKREAILKAVFALEELNHYLPTPKE